MSYYIDHETGEMRQRYDVAPAAPEHPAYWIFVGVMLTLAVIWLLNGAH
jgi:hypothetical protein